MTDKEGAIDKLKGKLYSRAQTPQSATERSALSRPRQHVGRVDGGVRTPAVPAEPLPQPPAVGPDLPGRPPEVPAAPSAPSAFSGALAPLSKPPLAMQQYSHRHRTFAARFFWGSLAFFVLAAGVAFFTFFGGSNVVSSRNIEVQVVAPSLIDSGKPTNLQFVIENNNSTELETVDLIIQYPDGTRSADDVSQALPRERQSIGTIGPGQTVKQTSRAVFFGPEGSSQRLLVTLEYQIPGSSAIFVKQVSSDFTIGSSPVSLSVSAPDEAIAGQPFSMDVTIQSNAASAITDLTMQAQYPFGFTLTSTDPLPASGSLWRLGTVEPGSTQTIRITGTVDGQDGDPRVFHFAAGSNADQTDPRLKVPLLSVPQTIIVRKPFVSGTIAVEGKTGNRIAAGIGRQLTGTVSWKNNLGESVSNVRLILSLRGEALDPRMVSAGSGFYDSSTNTIVWSPDQVADLAEVAPNAGGQFQFTFGTASPSSGRVLTNPEVALNLSVEAVRAAGSNAPETVQSAASARVLLASSIGVTATASHFSGPFKNTGPMPPAVNRETSYTINWTVRNSSNTIAGTTVSATLPPYVRFVQASQNEQTAYDAATRKLTWTLGDVKAGAGYGSPARALQFQVVFTPSLSQVGGAPALTGEATLSGDDRYAGARVESKTPAPNTMISGEAGFDPRMAAVVAQ